MQLMMFSWDSERELRTCQGIPKGKSGIESLLAAGQTAWTEFEWLRRRAHAICMAPPEETMNVCKTQVWEESDGAVMSLIWQLDD